ncbi:MAG: tripartite tricarboxylate transporter substrate binding protein [Curvibacter lanceolatus]|jgi:tripartite-type tricarboxylate transporter receptor subunit TctC|uniref:tripartite tricarboxylate transporter substrate binding protein n=1 Tax=Curvibacter lanceolatus TaxID=86182 RepID=UPI0003670E9B|nr:tripartite tricarboxylate transporter substrate binding protein [Curvibacter lanceolatus]MBV5295349.1 tripartite tricarboxylate transporter substrate binding protein [Curvibacter lanceolatus]
MKSLLRRASLKTGLALAALTLAGGSWAQSFPQRPVTLMVPYPAGGVSDVIARTVNTALGKHLGQPVVVENLGGVSGAIAAQKTLSAPADGYLLFQGSPNELILSPLANAAVKFKSEDFRLLQMISVAPLAVIARADLPVSNGDELAAYAARMAREGRPLTYASVGPGSFYHFMGEHMSHTLGVPMTHVPYKGAAPAFTDLMGGQVDIFITVFGKAQLEMAQQGRLKFVATLSEERLEGLKQVPTLRESRALKDFSYKIWTGYFVRKDTPEPVVQVLYKALTATLSDPAVRAGLEAQSQQVSRPLSLQEAAQAYTDGTAQFRALAKTIQLQPQ